MKKSQDDRRFLAAKRMIENKGVWKCDWDLMHMLNFQQLFNKLSNQSQMYVKTCIVNEVNKEILKFGPFVYPQLKVVDDRLLTSINWLFPQK